MRPSEAPVRLDVHLKPHVRLDVHLKPHIRLKPRVLVWVHGDEVVHSYHKATDNLEGQSPAYKGRSQLSPDQLAVGDASLRLTGVRASDHGKYTYDVANEQGRSEKQIFRTVAAAYEEPELAIQTTCNSVILTFLSTLGFPQPTVLWRTKTGSDITNRSNTTMVLKEGGKHYEVVNEMVLKQSDPHDWTVTFEMRLELLNQSFSHSVSLRPLPRRGQILHILNKGLPKQGTIL
ncbi:V-set domain-containing T-cell activation inhibitor 1-like [Conger conger]|uniref:V-set domain-containing T-cell activation inhibitor 1-like n=1 Tax=Conger conger TaxID=82655 RepID=UPI002A5A0850|nr:V-set domain-containing T-cell activation inhibitor 1-like [Conger conger]